MLKAVVGLVFPAPNPPTYSFTDHPKNLVYIPRYDPQTDSPDGTFTYGLLRHNPAAKFLVVYAHPNAVDIATMCGELERIGRGAQVSVLLFEFSGYGMCSGESKPSEEAIFRDTYSAHRFAVTHLRVPPNRIVCMGRSIGTSLMTWLCSRVPPEQCPALLFLQSPFTTLRATAESLAKERVWAGIHLMLSGAVDLVVPNWFRTIDMLPTVRCPILILHGDQDEVVPFSQSEELVATAEKYGLSIQLDRAHGSKHNDLSVSRTATLLHEKLKEIMSANRDPAGVQELKLHCEKYWKVRQPYFPKLFPTLSERGGKLTVGELVSYWRGKLKLGTLLFSREHFAFHLVASLSLFTMRCTYMWKILNAARRFLAATEPTEGGATGAGTGKVAAEMTSGAGFYENILLAAQSYLGSLESTDGSQVAMRRLSAASVVQQCAAVWGSPLGVHVAAAVSDEVAVGQCIADDVNEFKVFGARVVLAASAAQRQQVASHRQGASAEPSVDGAEEGGNTTSPPATAAGAHPSQLSEHYDTYDLPLVENRVYLSVFELAFTQEMLVAIHRDMANAPGIALPLTFDGASCVTATEAVDEKGAAGWESCSALPGGGGGGSVAASPSSSPLSRRASQRRRFTSSSDSIANLLMAHLRGRATAPSELDSLLAQDDVSLHESTVDALQQECDKLVGFMRDEDWERLQRLLSHLNSDTTAVSPTEDPARKSGALTPTTTDGAVGGDRGGATGVTSVPVAGAGALGEVSDHARLEYNTLRAKRQLRKGDIQEVEVAVRHWNSCEAGGAVSKELLSVVPWDYYLLRARSSVRLGGLMVSGASPRISDAAAPAPTIVTGSVVAESGSGAATASSGPSPDVLLGRTSAASGPAGGSSGRASGEGSQGAPAIPTAVAPTTPEALRVYMEPWSVVHGVYKSWQVNSLGSRYIGASIGSHGTPH